MVKKTKFQLVKANLLNTYMTVSWGKGAKI